MKNLSFILIISILTSNVHAQLKIATDGKVGVGTDFPAEKLHIIGSVRGNQTGGSLRINTSCPGYVDIGPINSGFSHFYTDRPFFYFSKPIVLSTGEITSYNTNNLILQTGSNPGYTRVTITNSGGNVGIGKVPSTNAKLDVAGNIYMNGSLVLTSDTRFKENIKPLEVSFDRLALLNPISFNYTRDIHEQQQDLSADTVKMDAGWLEIEEAFSKQTRYGFSAQELREVYPDLVTEDAEGRLGIDYLGLIPILVDALKEQQLKIETLEKKVQELAGVK
jgi:hypothetical protein